jgi:hypothetical protein
MRMTYQAPIEGISQVLSAIRSTEKTELQHSYQDFRLLG